MIASGEKFSSSDPATGAVVWRGRASNAAQIEGVVAKARAAQRDWATLSIAQRHAVLERYSVALEQRAADLAHDIARENGKPLWEARAEVSGMIAKVGLSIRAQEQRAGMKVEPTAFGNATLRHRPHGIIAVLGPFNFPGHLPNGHIVPALLAGNAVIFKPSEKTPLIGEHFTEAFAEAGLPPGLFAVVQGGREVGEMLVDQDIDGLLFTGSSQVAGSLRSRLASRPHVVLALELGGNNPLVAWDGDAELAASVIAESAFISAGQRCSCARRLIVPDGSWGDLLIAEVAALSQKIAIGRWDRDPQPFMGPLIDTHAADAAMTAYAHLVALGGVPIVPLSQLTDLGKAFLSPGVIDVTGIDAPDEEIFAPLLQVTRVPDWNAALQAANATQFGLASGLITEQKDLWSSFQSSIRAGIVNLNRPTTGASGAMPFGGVGESGNHRPSAWYAADYCAYPVAQQEATQITNTDSLLRLSE